MPIKDPDTRREYHRDYYARYREARGGEIAERQAQWFQENKGRAVARRRRNRALERATPALEAMPGEWRELARALVALAAEKPETPRETLAALVGEIPGEVWSAFVAALPRADAARWGEVMP